MRRYLGLPWRALGRLAVPLLFFAAGYGLMAAITGHPDRWLAIFGWSLVLVALFGWRSAQNRADLAVRLLVQCEAASRPLRDIPPGVHLVRLLTQPHEDHTDVLCGRVPDGAPWHTSS